MKSFIANVLLLIIHTIWYSLNISGIQIAQTGSFSSFYFSKTLNLQQATDTLKKLTLMSKEIHIRLFSNIISLFSGINMNFPSTILSWFYYFSLLISMGYRISHFNDRLSTWWVFWAIQTQYEIQESIIRVQ